MAATDETLHEGAALSHGAGALVRLRPRVLGEALTIGFISRPVDESGVMPRDEDPPFRTGQTSNQTTVGSNARTSRSGIRLKPEPYFVYIDWRHGPGSVSCDLGEQG
jgi:hypothetical protein